MTDWPNTLPVSPLAGGFSETVPDNIMRTSMDSGVAKIRRRSTSAPRQLRAFYLLSKTDIVTLDNFYLGTLKSGSLTFNYTHPRTGVLEIVRFLKPPEYSSENGSYFRTAISLEILP